MKRNKVVIIFEGIYLLLAMVGFFVIAAPNIFNPNQLILYIFLALILPAVIMLWIDLYKNVKWLNVCISKNQLKFALSKIKSRPDRNLHVFQSMLIRISFRALILNDGALFDEAMNLNKSIIFIYQKYPLYVFDYLRKNDLENAKINYQKFMNHRTIKKNRTTEIKDIKIVLLGCITYFEDEKKGLNIIKSIINKIDNELMISLILSIVPIKDNNTV